MTALRLSPVLAAWAELAALVNTRPRPTDPPEKLAGLADLERLLADAPEPAPAPVPADLAPMRELRESLTAAFEATTLDALAGALNPVLERAALLLADVRDAHERAAPPSLAAPMRARRPGSSCWRSARTPTCARAHGPVRCSPSG